MRSDQIERLTQIEEKLVDVFTSECQPETWPTMEDYKSRGDRYWHKKNALATLRIVGQIDHLLRDIVRADRDPDPKAPGETEVGELERDAAKLERRARAVLKRHGIH